MDHRQYRQWAAKVASRWGVMWDKMMGREHVRPGRGGSQEVATDAYNEPGAGEVCNRLFNHSV
jgi:hypothetical protein